MFCVVGLGNPGERYQSTPHNLGFLVVDELAARMGMRLKRTSGAVQSNIGRIRGQEVLLVEPQTFMNLSGPTVAGVLKSHDLSAGNLILVHDELDLPWSGLRIKIKGSAAGHNGVKSVIAALKTDVFIRVRVGIRPEHDLNDAAGYVLAPFKKELKPDVSEIVSYTADAVEAIIAEGAVQAMTKFNRRARGIQEEE